MLSSNSPSNNLPVEELLQRFSSGSLRQRRSLIKAIDARAQEIASLGKPVMSSFDPEGDEWAAGWILQVLNRHQPQELSDLLEGQLKSWFKVSSSMGIDYAFLQENLLSENFEEADRFTSAVLRKLAGKGAENRGYVYFSEVPLMPAEDLVTLDRLWIAYSQGKFGFSVQGRLLDSLDGRFDRLWPRIGWKTDGIWTRYPASFDWSLNAPEGHMPLINQLRGVRLMDALLNHPALLKRRQLNN